MAHSIQGEGGYQSGGNEPNAYQPISPLGATREAHTGFAQYGTTSTVEAAIETGTIRDNNPIYVGECDKKYEDPDMGWLTTVSIDFSDIVKEQKGTETIDDMKPIHRLVYHFTRDWFYKVLVLLTGVFLAFTWGLIFGACSYLTNWWWTPIVRLSKRCFYALSILSRGLLRGCLGPFYGGMEFMWNAVRYFRSNSHIIGAVVEAAH